MSHTKFTVLAIRAIASDAKQQRMWPQKRTKFACDTSKESIGKLMLSRRSKLETDAYVSTVIVWA
eukprot:16088-Heterococcus_DN1.PRE.1